MSCQLLLLLGISARPLKLPTFWILSMLPQLTPNCLQHSKLSIDSHLKSRHLGHLPLTSTKSFKVSQPPFLWFKLLMPIVMVVLQLPPPTCCNARGAAMSLLPKNTSASLGSRWLMTLPTSPLDVAVSRFHVVSHLDLFLPSASMLLPSLQPSHP